MTADSPGSAPNTVTGRPVPALSLSSTPGDNGASSTTSPAGSADLRNPSTFSVDDSMPGLSSMPEDNSSSSSFFQYIQFMYAYNFSFSKFSLAL